MKRWLFALAALPLLAAPVASATLAETLYFDNTIAVYWSTNPSTYIMPKTSPPSIPIPVSGGVCEVDTDVIDAAYADLTYGPSVITVRTEDVNEGFAREPFALGACMDQLVDVLATNYPNTKVLLDVTWLFWTDAHRETLYANYVDAADTFWDMAQASGSVLSASDIYGIVVNDEAYNAHNTSLNSAVQYGVSQWTSWSGVDRWVGFSLTDSFGGANSPYTKTISGGSRGTNGFPWRYDVIAFDSYWVFNPRIPGYALNEDPYSGDEFDVRYANFKSLLREDAQGNPLQRAHVNVRSFWHDSMDNSGWTIGGTGWDIDQLDLVTRAWCRWAKDHPEVESWSFWSYDQHQTLPPTPTGPDDPNDPNDDNDAGAKNVQASTLYDASSPYYVPGLAAAHDTVLRHGGSSYSYCP
jgi:hypothetical protein